MKRLLIDIYKQLFVRKALYRFHQRLLNVSLWGLGMLNSENDRWSGEANFLKTLPQYLDQAHNLVVFDIGANVGHYASKVKTLYPDATLYAFEPNPTSYQKLQHQAQEQNYHAYNLGLGDEVGQANLYDRQSNPGSVHASVFREVVETLHHDEPIPIAVQITTVDRFVEENDISRIHLLKSDTEGNDLSVLRGARRSLSAGIIDVIQFEFNEMNVISKVFMRDFVALLPDYTLYRMLPDGLVPLSTYPPFLFEIFAFQNIAAIRNRP